MAVNSTALRANVRAVSDLFFSGSQTVTKGDEVIWILDETYAFKVTEKCAVSTNASPFVNLQAGDVFIIYKRTEDDITAKNAKGIYIFDRDTVVGLAYPQEVTQDIVIENDIYANNYNSVVIEADKTPTAKITVSNMQPTIGDIIKIDGSSSYGVSPAIINSWRWKKNGVSVSTSPSFTYKVDRVGQDDITLVVTDNGGRKANTQVGIMIKAKPVVVPPPVIPPVIPPAVEQGWRQDGKVNPNIQLKTPIWITVLDMTSSESGQGTTTIKCSSTFYCHFTHTQGGTQHDIHIGLFINGVLISTNNRFFGVQTQTNSMSIVTTRNMRINHGDRFEIKLLDKQGNSNYYNRAGTNNYPQTIEIVQY